jgi:hypothetical protein
VRFRRNRALICFPPAGLLKYVIYIWNNLLQEKQMAIIKMEVNTGRSNFKSREQEKPVNK